jgi:sigma-B regulation protein RsbU (phosphoserine phosphatase)
VWSVPYTESTLIIDVIDAKTDQLAETRGESYLTCIVVRLDERARQLTSTTAGHPPALVTGEDFRRLTRGGPPAGLLPNSAYEQETLDLASGNRVIIVTDGITERISGGFENAIAELEDGPSAEKLCAAVFHLSEGPRASTPIVGWDDDRTVLVLAVDFQEEPRTRMDLGSGESWLR